MTARSSQKYEIRILQDSNDKDGVLLTFTGKLASASNGKKPGKTQARIQNSTVLTPDVSLKDYKSTAVIDWIELEMTLIDKVHLKDINRIMKEQIGSVQHIDRFDPDASGYFRHFSIRIQEPNFRKVQKARIMLEDRYLINSTPQIRRMEISVDFYSKTGSDKERGILYGYLARHFFVAPDNLVRRRQSPRYVFLGENGDKVTEYVFPEIEPEEPEDHVRNMQAKRFFEGYHGATYYVGEKSDDGALWRLMHKVLDKQNHEEDTRQDLADNQRRVRLEISLGPEALADIGITNLDDLKTLKLTSVASSKLFAFRLPTFALNGNSVEAAARRIIEKERIDVFLRAGVQGLAMFDQSRKDIRKERRQNLIVHVHKQGKTIPPESRRGNGKNGEMVNWMDMVHKVEHALRNLDKRVWRQMQAEN